MRLCSSAAVAAGVALFLLLYVVPATAQPPAASRATTALRAPSPAVVVLDVALVFKNHARFKQRLEDVRREIERFEREFAQERQAIVSRGEKLVNFKSGSREYKEIEARMARELAELRIKAVARKGQILEREGKIYHETYQEIVAVVARLAGEHSFSLVARYDSEATDPLDRGSILKAINRDVVYQRNLDITKLVIREVNVPSVAKVESPR